MYTILRTLGCFILLSIAVIIANYSLFVGDYSAMKEHMKDTISLKSHQVSTYFKILQNNIDTVSMELGESHDFNEEEFSQSAQRILASFPTVFAFNFLNSEHVIKHVFPFEKNKSALGKNLRQHPDKHIRHLMENVISKDKMILTGPVSIYQGGKAIVIYSPVKFKNGSYGWVNIVVKITDLFNQYLGVESEAMSSISIQDDLTKGFFFGEKFQGVHYNKVELDVLNRKFIFLQDLDLLRSELVRRCLYRVLFQLLLVVLLCVFVYFYFEKQRKEKNEFIKINHERNLMRVVFHDLASPIMILRAFFKFQKLEEHKAFRSIKTIEEIVVSLRDLEYSFSKSKKSKEEINIKDIFGNLLLDLDDIIQARKLEVSIENKLTHNLKHHIPADILKNQVLNNILKNAVANSIEGSHLAIELSDNSIKTKNKSEKLSEELIKKLNETKALKENRDSGHGYGHYIASIIALNFEINIQISQDENNIVTTELIF